jgi:hypothetical protein
MGAAKESELLGCFPSLTPFPYILFHSSSFQIPQSPYNPHFVASRDSCHFLSSCTDVLYFLFQAAQQFLPDKDFSELHLWISWHKKQELQMMHPENFLVRRQN